MKEEGPQQFIVVSIKGLKVATGSPCFRAMCVMSSFGQGPLLLLFTHNTYVIKRLRSYHKHTCSSSTVRIKTLAMQLATPVYTVRVPSFFKSWNTSYLFPVATILVVHCVNYIPQTVETAG